MLKIQLHEISNGEISLSVLNLGGIITKIMVPNNLGKRTNVVLNYSNHEDYITDPFYLGCIAGRFANRIGNGYFELDGQGYTLSKNNGNNHLHGGDRGFNKVFWNVTKINNNKLELTYTSPNMEEGYPGEMLIKTCYELTKNNELLISYTAKTDKKTIINLTNHSYFNLSGIDGSTIYNHNIEINSEKIVAVNHNMIPSGQLVSIKNTPFDFMSEKNIGSSLITNKTIFGAANGYDHCYVYNDNELKQMAVLSCADSGIKMRVYSTEPGMQFYTGNYLNIPFQQNSGVCLETQHFPDSPNQPNFPTTILNAGSTFYSQTAYKFEVFSA